MKCKRCGKSTLGNKFVCPSCMEKFTKNRLVAYAQVEAELGKLSPENQSEFVKRLKKIEGALKKQDAKNEETPRP